jgi:phage tail-like protein
MAKATSPYASHNYVVSLEGPHGPEGLLGGFSDASGLSRHAPKITGLNKSTDITLKRGVINALRISDWISQARTAQILAQREVIITLHDSARNPVQRWKLHNVVPAKYTGPALSGKDNDVAVEELVLSAEKIEIVPHH